MLDIFIQKIWSRFLWCLTLLPHKTTKKSAVMCQIIKLKWCKYLCHALYTTAPNATQKRIMFFHLQVQFMYKTLSLIKQKWSYFVKHLKSLKCQFKCVYECLCVLNFFATLLWRHSLLSREGENVALQSPLGAITGTADAGNGFSAENNTLE